MRSVHSIARPVAAIRCSAADSVNGLHKRNATSDGKQQAESEAQGAFQLPFISRVNRRSGMPLTSTRTNAHREALIEIASGRRQGDGEFSAVGAARVGGVGGKARRQRLKSKPPYPKFTAEQRPASAPQRILVCG
jgi:hypothetical protein